MLKTFVNPTTSSTSRMTQDERLRDARTSCRYRMARPRNSIPTLIFHHFANIDRNNEVLTTNLTQQISEGDATRCGNDCPFIGTNGRNDISEQGVSAFQLQEEFADSSIYMGYSFGDHVYRECSECHHQDEHHPEQSFVFTVKKRADRMDIEFYSVNLLAEVISVIGDVNASMDGLQLLKYHNILEDHLKSLRKSQPITGSSLADEFELLVNGFLGDHEPFSSFGYEKLFEQGYMTFERLNSFQHARIDNDIDTIERSFHTIDEAGEARRDRRRRFLRARALKQKVASSENSPELAERPTDGASDSDAHNFDDLYGELEATLPRELIDAVELELDALPDLIRTEADASRALPIALKAHNLRLLRWLLDNGADTTYLRSKRPGPIKKSVENWMLPVAIEWKHLPLAKLLLELGVDVNADECLLKAVQVDSYEIARILITSGAVVDSTKDSSQNPLWVAAKAGNLHLFQLLFRNGTRYPRLHSGLTSAHSSEAYQLMVDHIRQAENPLPHLASEGWFSLQNISSSAVMEHLNSIGDVNLTYNSTSTEIKEPPQLSEVELLTGTTGLQDNLEPPVPPDLSFSSFSSPSLFRSTWEFVSEIGNLMQRHNKIDKKSKSTSYISDDVKQELQSLRAVLRTLMESVYRCPEKALFLAAAHGRSLHVEYILQSAKQFSDRSRQNDITLLDNDIINGVMDGVDSQWSEMTALMVAVKNGDVRIVKSLLRHGVDVNVLTPRGTALNLAAELGSDAMMQLLLRKGADLREALFAQSALLSTATRDKARREQMRSLQKLEEVIPEARIGQFPYAPGPAVSKEDQARGKLRHLHLEFSNEHSGVLKAAGLHSQDLEQSEASGTSIPHRTQPSWAKCVERSKRLAWKSGIRVMRKLTRGKVPNTIHETIMFLTIVKAISTVRDIYDPGVSDYRAQFLVDLSRWQLLFISDSRRLEDFGNAVRAIWGVELESSAETAPSHFDTLDQLQHMALRLVQEGAPFLRLEESEGSERVGLLLSQQRWRMRIQELLSSSKGVDSANSACVDMSKPDIGTPDIQILLSEPPEYGLKAPITNARRLSIVAHEHFDPMIPLLMAGTIFGILLAFLIDIDSLHSKRTSIHMMTDSYTESSLQEPVMRAALHHVFSLLQESDSFDTDISHNMKSNAEYAIGTGLISSFSSLIGWLMNSIQASSLNLNASVDIQSYLHTIHRTWSSTYAVQETYRALEVYLGFEQFGSIVPHTNLPETLQMVHQIQTDGLSASSIRYDNPPLLDSADHASRALCIPVLPPRNTTPHASISPHSTSSTSPPSSISPAASPSTISASQQSSASQTLNRTFCAECSRDFKKLCNYNKHRRDKHEFVKYECRVEGCGLKFSRNHYRKVHEGKDH